VDICGFPKDRFYLYQSEWTQTPMVHVLPHWNWKGKEGELIPVFAYTNAEEVELFVNGESAGKRIKGVDKTAFIAEFWDHPKGHYESEYRVNWEVPYQPGKIEVVAYTRGKEVARDSRATAGTPSRIQLETDRSVITADGKDLAFVTVKVLDKDGVFCPLDDHLITFEIEGAGELAGVGNGDSADLTSLQSNEKAAFNGMCLAIIRSKTQSGKIHLRAYSKGLTVAEIEILAQER